MLQLIKHAPVIIKNMGWSYAFFRLGYELRRKTGLLANRYPTEVLPEQFVDLAAWKRTRGKFFFPNKQSLRLNRNPDDLLRKEYEELRQGTYFFFNSRKVKLESINWLENPFTGYQYPGDRHWTKIEDIVPGAGDIKDVWELSRFSFLYTAIRYDHHFDEDCSAFVIDTMLDWIEKNKVNSGPNFKCSQELSLRVMNWSFFLYYYSDSPNLTDEKLSAVLNSIYWQGKHIFENINFSLKTVRNNHAIAETLALYLIGLLYPFFPEAEEWRQKGKEWLEREILYQIYPDGGHLMYSLNYQRTVLQMLTWFVYLSRANKVQIDEEVLVRIKKSAEQLRSLQDEPSGKLPNYGHNDGSLFCKLNQRDFRDFRPQLDALLYFFRGRSSYPDLTEDVGWYNGPAVVIQDISTGDELDKGVFSFDDIGYYCAKNKNTTTFIRCGKHKDRPSQADNLHLDIWHDGKNILRDSGTYKYNTKPELIRYFNGTVAHNTVGLGESDQMLKGPRFIWLNWSQALKANIRREGDHVVFNGSLRAFEQLAAGIVHKRKVIVSEQELCWVIEDEVSHVTERPVKQFWHINPEHAKNVSINSVDGKGNPVSARSEPGYYSGKYGQIEECKTLIYETTGNFLRTTIKIT
jgi:hypothetical protein